MKSSLFFRLGISVVDLRPTSFHYVQNIRKCVVVAVVIKQKKIGLKKKTLILAFLCLAGWFVSKLIRVGFLVSVFFVFFFSPFKRGIYYLFCCCRLGTAHTHTSILPYTLIHIYLSEAVGCLLDLPHLVCLCYHVTFSLLRPLLLFSSTSSQSSYFAWHCLLLSKREWRWEQGNRQKVLVVGEGHVRLEKEGGRRFQRRERKRSKKKNRI